MILMQTHPPTLQNLMHSMLKPKLHLRNWVMRTVVTAQRIRLFSRCIGMNFLAPVGIDSEAEISARASQLIAQLKKWCSSAVC